MADLEFKHKVPALAQEEQLPEPIERRTGVEPSGIPNYQQAISNYAANTNWMSELGSNVASIASQNLAKQLGTELGKNPKGELSGPPITDFDKAFSESYNSQAQATLGLQANKLISQANIEMAQAPRITPELISVTNNKISTGLTNIFNHAPSKIKSQLEYQYRSIQVSQTEQLMNRMFREQKEDRQNNYIQFSKVTNQNMYEMGLNPKDLDENGDSKVALSNLASIEKSFDVGVKNHDMTPQGRDSAINSAWQSYLSGKYSRLGLIAYNNKKLDEFLADFANKPPKDVSTTNHDPVFRNVAEFLQHHISLNEQHENILKQAMENRIAKGEDISNAEMSNYQSQVSPLKFLQTQFKQIQTNKTNTNKNLEISNLATKWANPTAQAMASNDLKNATFIELYNRTKQNDPNLSDDDAIVYVGKSAGAVIPAITNIIHNKLNSGQPAEMESGVNIVDKFKEANAGHAVEGLTEQDNALIANYRTLRNPKDPTQTAQLVINNAQNMKPEVLKITDSKWANLEYTNTKASGTSIDQWILKKFGFKGMNWFGRQNRFDSPYNETLYAADIYGKYRSLYRALGGDDEKATNLTQEWVNANYGITYMNGQREWSRFPLEKTLGFESGEGIPAIHSDFVRQIQGSLDNLKDAYDNKASDYYWTIESTKNDNLTEMQRIKNVFVQSGEEMLDRIFYPEDRGKPYIVMTKHSRAGLGTKTERFPVTFSGTNFDKWDVNVKTKNGPFNLGLIAPYLGFNTYTPDRAWIINEYMGNYHNFPYEKFIPKLREQLEPKSDEQILESFKTE